MKRMLILFLAGVLLLCAVSCTGKGKGPEDPTTLGETEQTTTAASQCEVPETLRFDGGTFTFAVYENVNVNNLMFPVFEESDSLNKTLVDRRGRTEERFGIELAQLVYPDQPARFQNPIQSGLAEFDVANVRCTQAIALWSAGLLTPVSQLPYVDAKKDYWCASINDSISLRGENYTLIGDMLVSSYDLTYALLFNQSMTVSYGLEDPFEIVGKGDWTTEKMFTMMKSVTQDRDMDGQMTEADIYGYVAHSKQVLPNFWIAAGEKSIRKDEETDMPYLAMGSERFIEVVDRVFDITWDAGTYRKPEDERISDIPIDIINLFAAGQALFIDTSFFYITQMNSLTSDFGVIPYPKFDEEQRSYYSRLSYYNAPVVPLTNGDPDMVGAVLEYFNYVSREIVVPEYYDRILKIRSVSDERSSDMLDLIFRVRVTDIGDTTLCDEIRDGFVYDMFRENDRNLVSKLPEAEAALAKLLEGVR